MTLDYRNGISIAEIIVYVPCLAIAMFLAINHGFGRNSGWLFLITFALARIIGPCLQLATISSPRNVSLYIGSAILNNIGFAPLILVAIGLLSRLLDSIHKTHNTLINTKVLKFVETIITVALILGIVGGINAGNAYQTTGKFQPGTLNKAGTALLIVSWVLVVIATAVTLIHTTHAEKGEKRLLVAIALSLPFLLIRLIYSSFSTFSTNKQFNLIVGSPTVLLCVALIEELVVVLIFESVGLTLSKVVKEEQLEGARIIPSSDSADYPPRQQQQQQQKTGGAGNTALNIAKKTIIGRIVMKIVGGEQDQDVEMQHQRRQRHHRHERYAQK